MINMSHMAITGIIVGVLGVGVAQAQGSDIPQHSSPVAAYCLDFGGQLQVAKEASGIVRYCRLPDGRVMELWELMRTDGVVAS